MKARGEKGVSVLEMAVVLAIVSTLAAVAVPAFDRAAQAGENAKCLSNLRQIGGGILAYAGDHDGSLPGPLNSSQYPYWEHYSQITFYLADYIDLDKTRAKLHHEDVFVCPSYVRAMRKIGRQVGDFPVYMVNIEVPFGSRSVTPFGYANEQNPKTFGTSRNFPPMRLAALSEIHDADGPALARTWMLKDIDQLAPLRGGLSFNVALPKSKVHGTHRNALFFDLHVAPVDFDPSSKNPK